MSRPGTELDERIAGSVRQVIEGYFAALDSRDLRGIADCFSDDADIEHRGGALTFRGGHEVAVSVLGALRAFPVSHHQLVSLRLERIGGGVSARYSALVLLGDASAVRVRGVDYDDEFREIDGAYRIARRRHRPHWENRLTPNL